MPYNIEMLKYTYILSLSFISVCQVAAFQ